MISIFLTGENSKLQLSAPFVLALIGLVQYWLEDAT